VPPVCLDTEGAGEGRHRAFYVHHGRCRANRLAGKVDQHQTRFLPVGQPQLDKLTRLGVDGGAGFEAQGSVTLFAVPLAHVIAGVLVGDAALAMNGVQEVDPTRRVTANRGRSIKEALLVSGEYQPSEILGHIFPAGQLR
jgi:hypothetical protein